MRKSIEHAFDNGIAVTFPPRGKKAHSETGWQNSVAKGWKEVDRKYAEHLEHFNVGFALTSDKSNGFVEIDVDSEIARRTLPYGQFPDTEMIWGRPSNPDSHHGYRTSNPIEYRAYKDANGTILGEVRTGNRYTLAPGSIHDRDDEEYEWSSEVTQQK